MKKISIIIFFAVFIIAGVFIFRQKVFDLFQRPPETYLGQVKDIIKPPGQEVIKKETANNSGQTVVKEETVLPGKISVKVPFTSQAPFGVWDAYHEEACEEASLVMVAYYLNGKNLNKDTAEKEIQDLIQFEIANYGNYIDSDTGQVVKLAQDFYKITKLSVIYDFKKEDIKKELAKGKPIIIPAAGRELHNPYYKQPGPLYHMLVLVGYSGDEIITNDPGTRRGEGYRYNVDVLYTAIHDFPGDKNKMDEGRKAMIVIE
jgi:hypothetical protein